MNQSVQWNIIRENNYCSHGQDVFCCDLVGLLFASHCSDELEIMGYYTLRMRNPGMLARDG